MSDMWNAIRRAVGRSALFDSRSYAPVEAYGVMFDLVVKPWVRDAT